ncbi:hypothetical protein ACQJBY_009559 [Aegilops geniculata]
MADPLLPPPSPSRPDRQPPSSPRSSCAHCATPPDPAPPDPGNHAGVSFHELSRRDPATSWSGPILLLQQVDNGNSPQFSPASGSRAPFTGSPDLAIGALATCSPARPPLSSRALDQPLSCRPQRPLCPRREPVGEATATARHSSNRTLDPPHDAGLHGPGLASPRLRPQPLPGDAYRRRPSQIRQDPRHAEPPPSERAAHCCPYLTSLLQQTFSGGSCCVCKLPQILGCL